MTVQEQLQLARIRVAIERCPVDDGISLYNFVQQQFCIILLDASGIIKHLLACIASQTSFDVVIFDIAYFY